MHTELTRRQFAGVSAGALSGLAVGNAPATASTSATMTALTTPAARAVRQWLDALIGNTAVGAVVSIRGVHGGLDLAAGRTSLSTGRARVNCRGRVASISKMMVATAALQEVQAKRWTLRTTIDDVLPGLWPGRGRVTLQQLLSHTSGMPDALNEITPGNNMYELSPAVLERTCSQQFTDDQIVRIARGMPWRFRPGEGYYYSNTGFVVVGMMLERAHRTGLEKLLRDRVFTPGGMGQTSLVRGYTAPTPQLYDYLVEAVGRYRLERVNLSSFSAAGAVMATTADVTDFLYNLFRGKLLSQHLVDRMCTPVDASRDHSYGLGMRIVPDDVNGSGTLYGHTGSGWGSVAHALSTRDGRKRMAYISTGRPYWWDGKARNDRHRNALRKAALRATTSRSALPRTVPISSLDPQVVQGARRYDAEVGPLFG
ncbi:beta-lactamase family protein [Kytococcus sedentarius]|uniref:Penicillin-binding protein, beta-lactamase class C n=1 Tax=Kytococcus sedentarius (strain ATCC 14392 / DSM 20547 / JCM 11482 / CCUG 33030 / NBRC 15357 / NCTC 11040 / CCM 314 / 541) TaxID=478801 RepID=C7NGH6_KYTSD|nr:serine hydrolase domain-containing protein [Kytococcus sedentarius]ACV06084.1 penicillin-binding protein, beta-lactamase class C [Kytococcus sedentarius DSM 20547]QQB64449.1 beta-lactamase family protein [Kytococcus sedentarius]STX12497.1 D-alanyl-D-alanine carboxypeptidase precursor [Kytococcus sedentarius]